MARCCRAASHPPPHPDSRAQPAEAGQRISPSECSRSLLPPDTRTLPGLRQLPIQIARLADCRFVIREVVADERGMTLMWDFTFRIRSCRSANVQTIHGASHLKFDAAGKVAYHRDYWDAAEELYAKRRLIGPVMRFLQRRLA